MWPLIAAGAGAGALGGYLSSRSKKKTEKKAKKAAIEAENKQKILDYLSNAISVSGGQGLQGFSQAPVIPQVSSFDWGKVLGGGMQGAMGGAQLGGTIAQTAETKAKTKYWNNKQPEPNIQSDPAITGRGDGTSMFNKGQLPPGLEQQFAKWLADQG